MAQRTLAAGFADTGIEKAAAKSAPAGKKNSVPSVVSLAIFFCAFCTTLRSTRYVARVLFRDYILRAFVVKKNLCSLWPLWLVFSVLVRVFRPKAHIVNGQI